MVPLSAAKPETLSSRLYEGLGRRVSLEPRSPVLSDHWCPASSLPVPSMSQACVCTYLQVLLAFKRVYVHVCVCECLQVRLALKRVYVCVCVCECVSQKIYFVSQFQRVGLPVPRQKNMVWGHSGWPHGGQEAVRVRNWGPGVTFTGTPQNQCCTAGDPA